MLEDDEHGQSEFQLWPIVVAGSEEDSHEDEDEYTRMNRKANQFAVDLRHRGFYTFDTRQSSDVNIEMKWAGEDPFHFPDHYPSPRISASRSLSGYGQERGHVDLSIRNTESYQERTVTYFEVLPWFIKPYLHTLQVHVQADDYDEEADNLVRFQDDLTLPLLVSLDYAPSLQRQRPFHLEAKLRIPAQSTVRLKMQFDKSFLRYAEHPPDAHRGFDIAPAIIMLEDGRRIYTRPALLEVAVPDFSMPYNVM